MPEWLRKLLDRRAALRNRLQELNEATVDENGEVRDFTTDEQTEFTNGLNEIEQIDERERSWREQEERELRASAHRRELGLDEPEQRASGGLQVVNEPNPVYRADDNTSSFFRDLATVQTNNIGFGSGITEARERLIRSQETRAGDMTTVAGAGGEFAPPLWLVEEFISLARAGRVTADLCNTQTLPSGVSSVNLPKVATGTATGVQQTQNSALQDTAMTTTSVSSGITTIGGKQIVSMQLLQQSGIPFDRVILGDLAADYAVRLDTQVLYGSNANGQLRGLVGVANNNAFTSAAPAPASVTNANSLYYTVAKAAATGQGVMFQPIDAVVMHPVRWAWIAGSVDGNGRPFVIPAGNNFNPVGTSDGQAPQGATGNFAGLPVYVDPNISLTANSATNQDEIYLVRRSELWLYESAVQTASFDATYADNASVLFRILGYAAFLPHRRSGAVQSIRGTGLVAPA
jgi:HK97 family phage major capsid protein